MRFVSRRVFLASLLLLSCHASSSRPEVASAAGGKTRLTLEQTMGQGEKVDFGGELPRYSWASDGVHLLLEEKERKVWIDPATWTESEPPAAKEAGDDGVASALAAAGVPEGDVKKLTPRSKT